MAKNEEIQVQSLRRKLRIVKKNSQKNHEKSAAAYAHTGQQRGQKCRKRHFVSSKNHKKYDKTVQRLAARPFGKAVPYLKPV